MSHSGNQNHKYLHFQEDNHQKLFIMETQLPSNSWLRIGISPMKLPEIKKLIDQGKYSQALEAIDNSEGEERLEGLILKSRILERKGELKEALIAAEGVLDECRSKGSVIQVLRANLMLGSVHYALRNIPELTDVLQEAEEIFSRIKTQHQDDIQECQGLLTFLQGCLNGVNGDEKSIIHYVFSSF